MPIGRNIGPKIAAFGRPIEYKTAGDEVAHTEVRREGHIENVSTKSVSKRQADILSRVIIRFKGRIHASTTKPLDEHILYDIDRQFGNSRIFRFFHNNAVIGYGANVRHGNRDAKFKESKKMFNFAQTYCDGYMWRQFDHRQSHKTPSSLHNLPVLQGRRPCVRHTRRRRCPRR